jgi:hypothetical protein
MRQRSLIIYFTLLLVMLAALSATAFRGAPQAPAPGERDGAVLADLAGSWTGTWEDTLYFVGGAITFEIAVDGAAYTATGTIDLSEVGYGLGVQTGTATGDAVGEVITFEFTGDQVGSGVGSINGATASGEGTVTSPMNFGGFGFDGTIADGVLWGTFEYDAGGAGKAMLWNTTPTAETSVSAVKANY